MVMAAERRASELAGVEAAEKAEERSGLYGFLAAIFCAELTVPLLRRLREPDVAGPLLDAGVVFDEDFLNGSEPGVIEDLAVEYALLFVGPGKHIPPIAAFHLDQERSTLCGPSTEWVRAFVERMGFEYRPEHAELPDHLAVELEFMQHIADQQARALRDGDVEEARRLWEAQRTFVTDHMVRWLPIFCDEVVANATHAFYAQMAKLLRGFIAAESEALSDHLNSPARV
jgi:TorA maturation chaperone TorD